MPVRGGGSRAQNENGGGRWLAAGLVIVAVLLVICIALVVRKRKLDELEKLREESIAMSIAEANATTAPPKKHYIFTLCSEPEIEALAKEYFDARLGADSSRILSLYGRKDTAADPALDKKLKAQADWIQGFNSIEVFDVEGLEKDEHLCLVRYDIDFRRTDTMAPGIMYFYAEKDADGRYRIAENLIKERVDLIEEALSDDEAAAMISDTDTRLREALKADATLALIYNSFLNGEVYKEFDVEYDKEQQVDLFLDPEASILISAEELAGIEREAKEAEEKEAMENALEVSGGPGAAGGGQISENEGPA